MRRRTTQAASARKATPAADPFYRPFAELAKQAREQAAKKKKEEAAQAAAQAKKPAAPPARPAEVARKEPPAPARPAPAPPGEEPPRMVDPDTFAIYMSGVRALDDRGAARIPLTSHRLERAVPEALPASPSSARARAASGHGNGRAAAAGEAPPRPDPDADARARMRSLVSDGIRFEISDDGERLEGRRVDVDPRELRLLRRGRYAIDGSLDLHGRRAEEARAAVEAFVRKRRGDGDRVVALIHGKGNHSPGGQAVLRGEIAAWLSQGASSCHVAAFATAPEEDGGTGTLLVLLAR